MAVVGCSGERIRIHRIQYPNDCVAKGSKVQCHTVQIGRPNKREIYKCKYIVTIYIVIMHMLTHIHK